MASSKYRYAPLLTTERSIRLAILSPGAFDDKVEFKLIQTALDNAPPYEALSYAWGEAEFSESGQVDESTLSLSPTLETALHYLRLKTEERVMWIDAICINQQDTPERSAQVSFMSEIYAHARRVVVWIGPMQGQSERAIQFLRKMGRTKASIERNQTRHSRQAASTSGLNSEDDVEIVEQERKGLKALEQWEASELRNRAESGEDLEFANIMASWCLGEATSTSSGEGLATEVKETIEVSEVPLAFETPKTRDREEHNNNEGSEESEDSDLEFWGHNYRTMGKYSHVVTGAPRGWSDNDLSSFTNDNRKQDWEALDELLCRPWFSRTWVVQEVWRATDAILQCGPITLRWKTFERAMSYSEAWDDMGITFQGTIREEKWLEVKRRYSLCNPYFQQAVTWR